MHFSGDLILLTHMLMSGSWHIYRPGRTMAAAAVAHADRDRDGGDGGGRRSTCRWRSSTRRAAWRGARDSTRLGPAPLADDFDAAAGHRESAHRGRTWRLGLALLDQKLMAGLGNVFKSEVAFACGLNPFRTVGTLSREQLEELVATSRKFLQANVAHTSGEHNVSFVPLPAHHGADATRRESLGVRTRRKALPALRYADPVRETSGRRAGQLLVSRMPDVNRRNCV